MRKKKNPFEANENRKTKHKPYGVKGNTYSGTDKSLVYSINKKSARQNNKKIIKEEIKEVN